MAITTSSGLTAEFVDRLTMELTLAPDPQYLFAELDGGARAGALQIPEILGRSGSKANLEAAMAGGLGRSPSVMNPRFIEMAKSFIRYVWEPGSGPGKTILVDQPVFLDAGLWTEASRTLTEGTRVSANPQPISMNQASLLIKEISGPHDGSSVAPIGISDFVKRRSVHDLVEYVGLQLRRDRNKYLDRVIQEKLDATIFITFGSGTTDDTPSADWTAGSNPLMDADIAAVRLALQTRAVPPFADGMYALILSPQHMIDLRNDSTFREVMRYFVATPENVLFSGHFADYLGFHVGLSNNIPTQGVGAGNAVPANVGYAFGAGGLGHASGMEVEARRSRDDDYQREDRVLWMAHEAVELLDDRFIEKVISC